MARRNIPKSVIFETLKSMHDLGVTYKEAAKNAGVEINTIQRWEKTYGDQIRKADQEIISDIVSINHEYKTEILDKCWGIQGKLLTRIEKLIEKTNSIQPLVQAMDTINVIVRSWEQQSQQPVNNSVSLYQQINNFANEKKNKLQGNK